VADWKSFTIQVVGKDFLEPVRSVLETLLTYLEILKAILETIKAFLIDFGNPIRALVEALIKLIEELFLALKQSGFFMYVDVPDPIGGSSNFDLSRGGFPAFKERFNASLYDTKDFNRPQPRSGSNKGGFVILMVDATSIYALLAKLARLLKFFGKGFETPRYLAPENFKAIPVGASGDPILAAANVFTDGPIEAIQLQWTLPTTQEAAEPGFSDVLQKVWNEFIPPSFLIERSEYNPLAERIDLGDTHVAAVAGIVEYDQPTNFEVKGQKTTRREVLRDDSGEVFAKFQSYLVAPAATQAFGHLGRFRFIDENVEVDKDYYYRVRAFSGDLDIDESTGQINFPQTLKEINEQRTGNNTTIPSLTWPSKTVNSAIPDHEDVIVGKPTAIAKARVPVDVGDFDAIEVLKRLFQSAFSLDFQLEVPENATFDSDGVPTGLTPPTAVGKGSMTNQTGILAGYESYPLIGKLASATTVHESWQLDPVTGLPPEMPWTSFSVKRQSARLADAVVTTMLDLDGGVILGFRDLMRGPLPKGSIDVIYLDGLKTLEEVVFKFTETQEIIVSSGGATSTVGVATLESVASYLNGYLNAALRLNVLEAIRYIKNFTLGGVPPDWIAVVPLRDIIPWAGGFLYDLLDKIQALLDAFSGVMDEIRNFIDLLIKKIDTLEAFIQFLIDILNFIESLEIGAYSLSVPEVDGSVANWVAEVDNAGGNIPPSGPGGYSGGIAMAYVAPDIAAFKKAFEIIFGV
jgi:hypothetical protein